MLSRSSAFFVLLLLALPILRQTENAGKHAVLNLVVQADADVLFHRHVVEQADVLERAGNTELAGLHRVQTSRVLAVDENRAGRGLIDLRQQVKKTVVLPAPLGTDQPADFRAPDGKVHVVDCLQAAELNAQMAGFQHGRVIHVAFRNDAARRHGNHLCIRLKTLQRFSHAASPSFTASFFAGRMRSHTCRTTGALPSSITAISTMA